MKASIVIIGDEILTGQTLDTNSWYLATQLDALGFEVVEILTISDTKTAIFESMQRQVSKVDLVILTGGLGPTNDDVSKEVFCDFFQDFLVRDPLVFEHVKALVEKIVNKPLSAINEKQALVPSKAHVLFNSVGTAPGLLACKDNTTFVSLPGVPGEMKTICQEQLFPYLKQHFSTQVILHRTVVTYGIAESLLAELLQKWEQNLPKQVKLAYLPSSGMVKLRLSCVTQHKDQTEILLDRILQDIPKQVVEYILAYQDIDMSEIICKELHIKNKTISFAESCTGGRLSVLFNSKAGSSAYFNGGVVTYATQSKIDVLGVDRSTIDTYSVVSEQVALEMAKNVQKLLKSDFAIATTGNAGPNKGDSDQEVGTVYVGIATPKKVFAKKYQFTGSREMVVNSAVSKGLELIYKEIIKK